VLVNVRCEATSEHVRRSHGGVAFGGYASFEAAVDRLLADEGAARTLGDAGRAYVEALFGWPAVTARYRRWLEGLVSAGSRRRSGTLVEP